MQSLSQDARCSSNKLCAKSAVHGQWPEGCYSMHVQNMSLVNGTQCWIISAPTAAAFNENIMLEADTQLTGWQQKRWRDGRKKARGHYLMHMKWNPSGCDICRSIFDRWLTKYFLKWQNIICLSQCSSKCSIAVTATKADRHMLNIQVHFHAFATIYYHYCSVVLVKCSLIQHCAQQGKNKSCTLPT